MTKKNDITDFLNLIEQLKRAGIYHAIRHTRDDAISIDVAVPGERWEIDFLKDGSVEIEVFKSDGSMHDEKKLEELFDKYTE